MIASFELAHKSFTVVACSALGLYLPCRTNPRNPGAVDGGPGRDSVRPINVGLGDLLPLLRMPGWSARQPGA